MNPNIQPPVQILHVADPVCPKCSYDLRGYKADMVTCPECGSRWSQRDLLWTTWQRNCDASPIIRQVNGMAALGMFSSLGLVVLTCMIAFGGMKLATQHPIFVASIAGFTGLLLAAFALGTAAMCHRLFGWHFGLRLMAVAVAEVHALAIGLFAGIVGALMFLPIATASFREMSPVWLVVCAVLLALCPISIWGRRSLRAMKVRLLFAWVEASADRLRATPDS